MGQSADFANLSYLQGPITVLSTWFQAGNTVVVNSGQQLRLYSTNSGSSYSWTTVNSSVLPTPSCFTAASRYLTVPATCLTSGSLYVFRLNVDAGGINQVRGNSNTCLMGAQLRGFIDSCATCTDWPRFLQVLIRVNRPPSGGNCTALPTKGVALVTPVLLRCQGWRAHSNPFPVTYSFTAFKAGGDRISLSQTQNASSLQVELGVLCLMYLLKLTWRDSTVRWIACA
jgi:hypothetical protein